MCSDAGHSATDTRRQNKQCPRRRQVSVGGCPSCPSPTRRRSVPRPPFPFEHQGDGRWAVGAEPAHVQKINPIRVNYTLSTANADEGHEFCLPQLRPVSPKSPVIQLTLQQSEPKFTHVHPRFELIDPRSVFAAAQKYDNFALTLRFLHRAQSISKIIYFSARRQNYI